MGRPRKNLETDPFDMSYVISNIDKVKELKALNKEKPKTKSNKPLRFEVKEDYSPLKEAIIKHINERELSYSDLFEYCTLIKNGDEEEGQHLGYNMINGVKNHKTMIDTTFSLWCDFLNLNVCLVKRPDDDEDDLEEQDTDDE